MRLFLLTVLYAFAAFGFAFIVGYATISLPLRQWLVRTRYQRWNPALQSYQWVGSRFLPARQWLVTLLQCPACLGFWIGVVLWAAEPLFGAVAALGFHQLPGVVTALVFGLATCASNFILGVLTHLIRVEVD